jgi:hypothetical protein
VVSFKIWSAYEIYLPLPPPTLLSSPVSKLSPSVVLKMTAGEGANTNAVVMPIVNISAIKTVAVIELFIRYICCKG